MKENDNQIILKGIFQKASTTIDGAWRISFDVPLNESENIKQIVELKNSSLLIVVLPSEKSLKHQDVIEDFHLDFDEIL